MCVSVLKLRNLEVTSNLCHGADLLHPGMYNLQIPVEVMPTTAAARPQQDQLYVPIVICLEIQRLEPALHKTQDLPFQSPHWSGFTL